MSLIFLGVVLDSQLKFDEKNKKWQGLTSVVLNLLDNI